MSDKDDELERLVAELETHYRKPANGADLYAKLLELDDTLARAGFPRMSEWWRDVLGRFYQSGKRWLVLRVGRRGGKSSTLCRMAVVEVLHGNYAIPPGDIGYWAFISTTREEASARLVTIRAILDALHVAYSPVENGIRLVGRNIGFKVYVATIAGVSGFTAIGFTADELAKWQDKDTGANPATEVLRSLRPTLASVPSAKGVLSSSPFSTLDAHAEAYARGDVGDQMVAEAPTWIANPTISEAMTKELEPDETTRLREYGAVPMSSGTQMWFDSLAIDRAAKSYSVPVLGQPGMVVTAGADFAFVSDAAALVVAHRIGDWEKARARIADLLELTPGPTEPLKPGHVVKTFAAKLAEHGLDSLMADQHYKMSIIEHLDEHSMGFQDAPLEVAKPYIRARVLLNGERLELPKHEGLIRQMKAVQWRPTPNGAISIILPRRPGAGHCDMVSALVLALWQRTGYEVPQYPTVDDGDRLMESAEERWRQRKDDESAGLDWFQRLQR